MNFLTRPRIRFGYVSQGAGLFAACCSLACQVDLSADPWPAIRCASDADCPAELRCATLAGYCATADDGTQPALLAANAVDIDQVHLRVSEPVAPVEASLFVITPDLAVIEASVIEAGDVIALRVAQQTSGVDYLVTASGVTDGFGNPLASPASAAFLAFGPVGDRNPPTPLAPTGAVFRTSVSLRWTRPQGAHSYTVTLARDNAFADVVDETTTSDDTWTVAPIDAGTYYWRVRADITHADEYGVASFDVLTDAIYVYCAEGACSDDDDDQVGSKERPFRTIAKAMSTAAQYGVPRILAARRPGDLPYAETVILQKRTELLGGYDATFDDATRDVVNGRTRIDTTAKPGAVAVTATGLDAVTPDDIGSTLFEGFHVVADGGGRALIVTRSDDALLVRHADFETATSVETSRVIDVIDSGENLDESPHFVDVDAQGGAFTGNSRVELCAMCVLRSSVRVEGGVMTGGARQVSPTGSGSSVFSSALRLENASARVVLASLNGGATASGGGSAGVLALGTVGPQTIDVRQSNLLGGTGASGASTVGFQSSASAVKHITFINDVIAGGSGPTSNGVFLTDTSAACSETVFVNDTIIGRFNAVFVTTGCVELTNNLLITTTSTGTCFTKSTGVAGRTSPGAFHANTLVGCQTLASICLGDGDCTSGAPAFVTVSNETDLNDSAKMNGSAAISVAANKSATIDELAATSLPDDVSLTSATRLDVRQQGVLTSEDKCGPTRDASCGDVVSDIRDQPRSCPTELTDCYARGAYEYP